MWTLRRASIHLRNQELVWGTARICCGKLETPGCCQGNYNSESLKPQKLLFDGLLSSPSFFTTSRHSKLYEDVRTFSSQADAKSGGKEDDDDDVEDGFSELETPRDIAEDDNEDEESDSEDTELDTIGSENHVEVEKSLKPRGISSLTKAILAAPASSVGTALDKWVEEGNEISQTEISISMSQLRRRRLYLKALQLSEWAESNKHIEFKESNYAARVDLISKVKGTYKAEEYLEQIPEEFRGELAYRTLLANYAATTNVKKCEKIFNKIRDLGLPLTCFSCNQLLLLYKRTDKKKIADVLLLMEKENIKPTLFTYWILIDVKGLSRDITGMEQIVETMKADGVEPDDKIRASLARHYVAADLKEKAEAVLKEMERDDEDTLKNHRKVYSLLFPIYASLGKEDEVERIWKACESNPRWEECLAIIDAWGKLGKVEKAEEAFNKLLQKIKKPNSKHFTALLKVYANHKMLTKGKELVKKMESCGCVIGPLTWDALVRLYVGAGEVEKAASILEKAVKQTKKRLMLLSYLTIMDKYSERGDVHNAEKMFLMIRRSGYPSRLRVYQGLVQAYINAKKPAYGFIDRMKADNIFPNKYMSGQLAKVDAFRKSAIADLLE
ncbi:pentatricopeptide repeat-containing protein At1g80270, mitochondrial-like [Andrographis paniculata]|uniref:pentatricopeptide repeat-containing protein At1g80270, mitochondrial-like n=1 Tax=Andrographis paniculata TaxID=175694 RepID=UPI0021E70841|nr:pentatricopeptide repeat-containing protein At1g80270, mitochondrial-like [Andrographis paniculata]